MKKKILSLLMAATLVVGMTGCVQKPGSEGSDSKDGDKGGKGGYELALMKTFIPDTKRYKKELVADKKAVFRSTLFPASRLLVRGRSEERRVGKEC